MMNGRHYHVRQGALVQGPFPITDRASQDPEPASPTPAIRRERRIGLLLVIGIVTLATLVAMGAGSRSDEPGEDSFDARASTIERLRD